MDGIYHKKSGYTLVEVLVSVGILVIFLPFAASMLTNSRLLASFSKHKSQAAYAAKQLIETQRQSTFISLGQGQTQSIPAQGSNAVILDTKGNYANVNCNNTNIFCGTSVVTVTPAVYTSTTGVMTTNTSVDHLTVTISWIEQIVNLKVPMTVTYAADVVNDAIFN